MWPRAPLNKRIVSLKRRKGKITVDSEVERFSETVDTGTCFGAAENNLVQTDRPIMHTRAVPFKPLCSGEAYGKPVEAQIGAQKAAASGSEGGGVCTSNRFPGDRSWCS